MANWMMTGMTKKDVEAANVFITRKGLRKLGACQRAVRKFHRAFQDVPAFVNHNLVSIFWSFDILTWVGEIYEQMQVDDHEWHEWHEVPAGRLYPVNSSLYSVLSRLYELDRAETYNTYGYDDLRNRYSLTKTRVDLPPKRVHELTTFVKAAIIAYMRHLEKKP